MPDQAISSAAGAKLSYFGYEFEVPWSDLDESQTKLYPSNSPKKNRVDLHFHSGLRLLITAIPAQKWAKDLSSDFNVSPQIIDSAFGHETMKSDYSFVKTLYEFTPDKMNHWAAFHGEHTRDQFLLIIKSLALPKEAESGIFRIQNQSYRGFQQGNPQVHPDAILVNLYSDDNSIEINFLRQKDCTTPCKLTQAEINRIVQTVHKATSNVPAMADATTQTPDVPR